MNSNLVSYNLFYTRMYIDNFLLGGQFVRSIKQGVLSLYRRSCIIQYYWTSNKFEDLETSYFRGVTLVLVSWWTKHTRCILMAGNSNYYFFTIAEKIRKLIKIAMKPSESLPKNTYINDCKTHGKSIYI